MPFPKLSLICFFLLVCHGLADLTFDDPTTFCTTQSVTGKSIYCCNGDCFDSSHIGREGLCQDFDNSCMDPINPPGCANNQVYKATGDTTVDIGYGSCYVAGCRWSSDVWSYSCCDCPGGYEAYTSSCSGPYGRYQSFCFGCTLSYEKLYYDSTTSSYSCINGPPVPCSVVNGIATATSILGLASTWVGAACESTSFTTAFTYLSDAYTLAVYSENPSNGILDNVAVFSAVVATILLFTGVPEEIEITHEVFCGTLSVLGPLTTYAGTLESDYIRNYCEGTVSKRSISLDSSGTLSARDGNYNPCLEFLNLFPADYSIIVAADSACDDILSYDVIDMVDEGGMGNVTLSLQQFCTGYQSSGNSTTLMNFVNTLSALQAAVPYCTNATLNLTLSSSLSLSSATSLSLFSSLASTVSTNGATTTSSSVTSKSSSTSTSRTSSVSSTSTTSQKSSSKVTSSSTSISTTSKAKKTKSTKTKPISTSKVSSSVTAKTSTSFQHSSTTSKPINSSPSNKSSRTSSNHTTKAIEATTSSTHSTTLSSETSSTASKTTTTSRSSTSTSHMTSTSKGHS